MDPWRLVVPSLGIVNPTASANVLNPRAAPPEDKHFVQPRSAYAPSAVVYSPHEVRITNNSPSQQLPAIDAGVLTPAILSNVVPSQTPAGVDGIVGPIPAKGNSTKQGKITKKTKPPKQTPKSRGGGLTRSQVGPCQPPGDFVAPRGSQWRLVTENMLKFMKDEELKEIVKATGEVAKDGDPEAQKVWSLVQAYIDRRHQLRNNRSARKARNKKDQELHFWKELALSLGAEDKEFEYHEPAGLHDEFEK
ncbi:hypothetical protein UCRPA7_6796 [Phaeoacremonium minimum UCRPA7]|uniref:BZIP domain-containing protein n=1 Tax=Phaeoacremonium minimum (strain UCR-PA7) TaxID=1286976 RepID=R8BDT4_PHAM7|nr:hypothetical protein UCRPA7_6796 [Phaeoacremonium minimum UCRPA7]EON97463.1 hypothetical protein UCRPA7_6796 [Phaeoacremonium minimum UCRPA7]